MNEKKKLEKIRADIDSLDKRLLDLISDRAGLAKEIAKIKMTSSESFEFYRPEREAQILRKIIEHNKGPLSEEEMARLFREIMSACLALEQVLDIAYLGPEGTFTQTAALKHFGHSVIQQHSEQLIKYSVKLSQMLHIMVLFQLKILLKVL